MIGKTENSASEKSHSRLGISSTIIGIIIPILLVLFLILGLALGSKKGTIGSYFSNAFVVFGLAAPILHLIGTILGISGFFSKKTKNLFPAIGTILNVLLGGIGILIIFLIITNIKWGFH